MGYRLTRIYTRTGDKGTTMLGDGSRVDKHAKRIETLGTIDELNSLIGIVLTQVETLEKLKQVLTHVQHVLFDLGGELSIPTHTILDENDVINLEKCLDEFNQHLPALTEFILPSGNLAVSFCHQARTVCRRAERCLVALAQEETLNPFSLAYINRLSDLLFVFARVIAQQQNCPEVYWQKRPRAF